MSAGPNELSCALADLSTGALLGGIGQSDPRLVTIASAASRLLNGQRASWELVIGGLDARADVDTPELVLVADACVYFALRCDADPTVMLVAVAPRRAQLGLLLSEARTRLSALQCGEVVR